MHIGVTALVLSFLAGLTPTQATPAQCSIQYMDCRNASLIFTADGLSPSWPVHGYPWFLVRASDPNMRNYLFSDDATDPLVQELVLYLYSEPIATLTIYNSCILISVSSSEILGDGSFELNPAQEEYVKKRLQEISYRVIAVVEAHYNIKCDVVESEAQYAFGDQALPPAPKLP